jgi:hypothetical protein
MSQQPLPDPAPPSSDGATDDSPTGTAEPLSPEPTVERSRFSQWLASFGLGELQNPLLTRARPPVPRPRT